MISPSATQQGASHIKGHDRAQPYHHVCRRNGVSGGSFSSGLRRLAGGRQPARRPERDVDHATPGCAARTPRSTNSIESMISISRNHSTNVKNWPNRNMALGWCAVGLIEAGKHIRRVNGHLHLPALRAALQRHVAEQTVGADRRDETVNVA